MKSIRKNVLAGIEGLYNGYSGANNTLSMERTAKTTLTDREYLILCHRLGLENNTVKSHAKVAELLGVSRGRIYDTERKIYSKFKRYLHNSSIMEAYNSGKIDARNFPLEDMGLPASIRNTLYSAGVKTAGDLASYSISDLRRKRTFGQKAIEDIKVKLTQFGLSLKEK